MNKTVAQVVLKSCVLLDVFLGIVACVLTFNDSKLLPRELASWVDRQGVDAFQNGSALNPLLAIILLLLGLAFVGALIASSIGLFRCRRWGAWLLVGLVILTTPLFAFNPLVLSGVTALLWSLQWMLTGFTLGVAFFGGALE